MPNYEDIYTTATENNKECIFEINYKAGTDGQSSAFIYRFIPATTVTTNILGVNFNNNKNNYGGWNVPTQDLINSYELGDKRLDASIAVTKGKYDINSYFIPDSVVSVLNPPTAGEVSKNFIRKFYHLPYGSIIDNTDQDWYVYRYADVLLMLAEALNEQGQTGAALPYLNKVRDTIAHERRVELAFENKRWFDLVRTDQAIPVMTANKMIYAIPFRENQLNPVGLWQNLGY